MLVYTDDELVLAGFTTKDGGLSKGDFEGLNLALHVGDDANLVMQNREILRQRLGVEKLAFMEQIHSDEVYEILSLNDEIPPCDALITSLKNLALCVMVADCAPILLLDQKAKKIAAIHTGRAGVTKKILSKTVAKMGSNPKNLKAIIGANIGKNCYEIGDLDMGEFSKFVSNGKFDINSALKFELDSLGVQKYEFSSICTHCDERFYSYRRDKITGRFCGFIALK